MGILLVTSEWSQRTALITFTLVPHRSRVLVAKLLARPPRCRSSRSSCASRPGWWRRRVRRERRATTWSLSAALIGQNGLSRGAPVIAGVGFGAVLLASAPAIVLYFVLPTAWGAIGAIHALEGAAQLAGPGRARWRR